MADGTPAMLGYLPAAVHAGVVAGYAASIRTLFLIAVPIAAPAFLATWLIPQTEPRRWPEAPAAPLAADQTPDPAEGTGHRGNGRHLGGASR